MRALDIVVLFVCLGLSVAVCGPELSREGRDVQRQRMIMTCIEKGHPLEECKKL